MFSRLIKPLKSKGFFLFGARGVGKSTFVNDYFSQSSLLKYDLLDPEIEDRFALRPQELYAELQSKKGQFDWVLIDEIQKCPKLLNIVHKLIFEFKFKFALTGSSARRLRQKGVNLLGGRALMEHLFPLTHIELGKEFNLKEVLSTGSLPETILSSTKEEKHGFLRSYTLNYLKNEVQAEQWVRALDPFRKFLNVAGQMNGKILNYTNIAKDIGVDSNTVNGYFDILEDTLMGFRLPAYNRSIRKQQRKAPKFYFFDLGVKRALDRTLDLELLPGTIPFGDAFEHFIVMEIYRLAQYQKRDIEISYLLTKDEAEIDLLIEWPGEPLTLIEIKSKDHVDERDIRGLIHFHKDFPKARAILLSNDSIPKQLAHVQAYPWAEGLQNIFH